MDAVRASTAPRAPGLPTSPTSRSSTFTGFMPASYYSISPDEDGGTAARKYSTSPHMDRRSIDQYSGQSDIETLLDGSERSTPPASMLLLRKLSASMSQEALNSMLIFASDLLDAQFVPHGDRGFQTAVARFSTLDGALEVRNRLHGKANASGDATMVVEVLKGTSADSNRRSSDAQTARHLSTSASSAASSSGHGKPSRFSSTFQSMDRASPTKASRVPGPIDLSGTHFSNGHVQGLFSPTSPMGIPNGDRPRTTGKTMIGDDAPDDETQDLLQNPLAYAEAGQRSRGRPPISQLANLRLDTNDEHPSQNGVPLLSPTAPGFPRSLPQPVKSPSSDLSQSFAMSPLSPGSAFPGSPQQYQRHQFPPANPADQNPPCNTLYVGNLPMDTVEEELKDLFSKQRGYKRLCFRTKHNGPMCFVEFEDVSFATKALNELYGSMLSNSVRSGIRLSFSKNPLGVRAGQANMHSPLISPVGAAYGPSGFSTANGPPPGLSAPPGLNNGAAPGAPDGSHLLNGHFYAQNAPQQPSLTNGHGFHAQNMPTAYMSPIRGHGYGYIQTGFPDIMTRR